MTHTFAVLALVLGATMFASATSPAQPQPVAASLIARGDYLARTMLCNDCHTPFKLGSNGPEPDMSRMLSGHPSELVMPPAPKLPAGPWAMVGAATNTAWAGPWGVSFTANLTPDKETGLGDWTFEKFKTALRTGKHEGKGRPILPPMPYPWIAQLTDDDLHALFSYLQSIPPIRNKVPSPIEPEE